MMDQTASSSNSFVNRRCWVIEFLIAHWGTLHSSGPSPGYLRGKRHGEKGLRLRKIAESGFLCERELGPSRAGDSAVYFGVRYKQTRPLRISYPKPSPYDRD